MEHHSPEMTSPCNLNDHSSVLVIGDLLYIGPFVIHSSFPAAAWWQTRSNSTARPKIILSLNFPTRRSTLYWWSIGIFRLLICYRLKVIQVFRFSWTLGIYIRLRWWSKDFRLLYEIWLNCNPRNTLPDIPRLLRHHICVLIGRASPSGMYDYARKTVR